MSDESIRGRGVPTNQDGASPVLFADPEEIEALARTLDDKAEDVRTGCSAFEREVARVRWQSKGAEHYRSQCATLAADVDGNAQELNDAADLLRAHAQQVRERIAWMHDMVAKLRNEAEEAWTAPRTLPTRRSSGARTRPRVPGTR